MVWEGEWGVGAAGDDGGDVGVVLGGHGGEDIGWDVGGEGFRLGFGGEFGEILGDGRGWVDGGGGFIFGAIEGNAMGRGAEFGGLAWFSGEWLVAE
jgi:hypothetical protein